MFRLRPLMVISFGIFFVCLMNRPNVSARPSNPHDEPEDSEVVLPASLRAEKHADGGPVCYFSKTRISPLEQHDRIDIAKTSTHCSPRTAEMGKLSNLLKAVSGELHMVHFRKVNWSCSEALTSISGEICILPLVVTASPMSFCCKNKRVAYSYVPSMSMSLQTTGIVSSTIISWWSRDQENVRLTTQCWTTPRPRRSIVCSPPRRCRHGTRLRNNNACFWCGRPGHTSLRQLQGWSSSTSSWHAKVRGSIAAKLIIIIYSTEPRHCTITRLRIT